MNQHPDQSSAIYLELNNYVSGAIFSLKYRNIQEPQFERLFIGDHFRSCEFGHMTLRPGGKPCYCGKFGCVNSYCSAKLLSDNDNESLVQFFSQLDHKSTNRVIWNEYLDNLAIIINSLLMAFDCQVILGGSVGMLIRPFLPLLQEKVSFLNSYENVSNIEACHYNLEGSALGAAIYLVDSFIQSV